MFRSKIADISSFFDISPDEIREGKLHRVLLVLSIPLLAQNLVRVLNQIVDLFWLGRLSDAAVAAVGLATPAKSLLLASAIYAPFLGTQIAVSDKVGADELGTARQLAFAGVVLALVFGVVVGAVVYVLAPSALSLLVEVRPQSNNFSSLAVAYLKIISLGIVAGAVTDVIEAVFVGWGDSRAALYVNVAGVITNLTLDPFLIFGYGPFPALGIRGAALATVGGFVASAMLGFGLMVRRSETLLTFDAVTLDPSRYATILEIGVPAGLQRIARPTAEMLIVSIVFLVGGAAGLAAYLVGSRATFLALTPARGLKQATQSIVGQNLGASLTDRAERATWIGVAMISSVLLVFGAAQWAVPHVVTAVFAPELDGDALTLSIDVLRMFALGYPAIGTFLLVQGGFNGAKRTRTSLVGSLVKHWGIRLPLAVTAGIVLGYGIEAVFWSIPISDVIIAFLFGAYYHSWTNGEYESAE